ncbi:hypothetical protein Megpolyxen_01409 [Candidatus Megaera polyxenophila]|nr:hypothetical protein Megpolyxen_01409 [Candidatus Megaera polyxenophila]
MALNPLIINKNYFSGVQARGDFIKAGDLDRQFVTISSYINKFIVPTLNQLISSQIPGSNNPVDANKNLINVGDGTTKWDFPKAEYIPDYSLPLTKLVRANPGSILATDNNQIFRAVTPSSAGLALTARVQNTPVWKKIIGNDSISNRVITSEKIALEGLRSENFGVSFERSFIRTIIRNQLIASNTIPTSKIANGAVTVNVLNQSMVNYLCGLNSTQIALGGNTAPDNFITSHKYLNYTPGNASPINYTKIVPGFKIPLNLYSVKQGYKAFTVKNIANKAITSSSIKDNSLNGVRIFDFGGIKFGNPVLKIVRPLSELLGDGCIGTENIPARWAIKLGLV